MTRVLRVLFVAVDSVRGPASRYRIVQFLPWLAAQGVEATFVPYLSEAQASRPRLLRLLCHVGFVARRVALAMRADRYDVVVVQREAALGALPYFEWILGSRVPIVLDLDDATFLPRTEVPRVRSHAPGKVVLVARRATAIVVASTALQAWARQFTERVELIPTFVDTTRFRPSERRRDGAPVIGWIGTPSSAPYLDLVLPALHRLARTQRFGLHIIGAEREVQVPGIPVTSRPWRLEHEVEDFQGLDIGLCPLTDDAWSRAKCGFKPLLYMASGVPQVSSPVGDVTRLVVDGETGYFARNDDEWWRALERLCVSESLRARFSRSARARAEAGPSLEEEGARLLDVLVRAAGRGPEPPRIIRK